MTVITKGRNFLLLLGACYALLVLCLLHPTLQRELFYLNSLKFPWLVDTSRPETCGFSPSRVRSIFLPGNLHVWHVSPLDNFMRGTEQVELSPKSKLIIYFHGTAGTLAIPHRLTTYRILTALPETHVLAIDYRGYGLSAGKPSEDGLIEDGISAVMWALNQGFDAKQITLFGQSLGSAVAIGVAHRLALGTGENNKLEVNHVVSIAGFYSASEVIKTYRLAGIVPILSPFRTYPWLQSWLIGRLQHKWDSASRVEELARQTNIRLTFAHAKTDTEIDCTNSERLFLRALYGRANANGTNSATAAGHHTDRSDLMIKGHKDGGRSFESRTSTRFYYKELYWGAHNLVQWNDELLNRL